MVFALEFSQKVGVSKAPHLSLSVGGYMNFENLRFQLSELRAHVDDLLESLANSSVWENDEASQAVELGHLLDHLNLAWNLRALKPGDVHPKMTRCSRERAIPFPILD